VSYLSSTIIEETISHCQTDPKLGVAYFYFDFGVKEKQLHQNLMRSLVTQLSIRSEKTPEALQELYSRSYEGVQQPNETGLETALRFMLEEFTKTYIIIDALDECTDRKELLELIQAIHGWEMGEVQILVTSRRETDIEDALELLHADQVCIQSAQINGDIQLHIREQLQKISKRWPTQVQEEIEEMLMSGAHGM